MSRTIGKPQSAILARSLVALLCIWTVSARPARAGLPGKYRIADLKALEKAFVDLAMMPARSDIALLPKPMTKALSAVSSRLPM